MLILIGCFGPGIGRAEAACFGDKYQRRCDTEQEAAAIIAADGHKDMKGYQCNPSKDTPEYSLHRQPQYKRWQWLAYLRQYCSSPKTHLSAGIASWSTSCPAGTETDPANGDFTCKDRTVMDDIKPSKNNDACLAGENGTNPIHSALGCKIQKEVDFDYGQGLSFIRYYSSASHWRGTAIGQHWRHSMDARVLLSAPSQPGDPSTAWVLRPNGDVLAFNQVADTTWQAEPDVTFKLSSTYSSSGIISGWILRDLDGRIESYDQDGRLIALESAKDERLMLSYGSGGRLQAVVNQSGRSLIFQYDASDRISGVTGPAGETYHYKYDSAGNLTSIAYPAGPSDSPVQRIYHYEDGRFPYALTGITDERNNRYASWSYDASGRAILSVRGAITGSIGRVSLAYNADGTTSIIDALNTTRIFSFTQSYGVMRLAGLSQPCASCGSVIPLARTYDINGFPDVETDFSGTTRDFDYSSRGLIVQQTESANRPATKRTTQTDWHPSLPVPTERRVYDAVGTLLAKQAWTYNASGQLLTVSQMDPATGATRTTTRTFCEQADIDAGACPLLGLVTSVDGPRTDVNDVTTYTYYPSDDASCATAPTTCLHRKGDLWKVTNALGQVTETLRYDGAGRVLTTKDANGIVTDYEYHPRGWLTARKVRGTDDAGEMDDAITRIDYYPTGLVQKVTLPDGIATTYTYDVAHRLTGVADGEGNRIHYTLDNAGNRVQEQTIGAAGHVLRTLSRVYNELGQLQIQADADANPTDYTYDANGNIKTVTDAYGRVTEYDYDPLNRLTRTLQDVVGIQAGTRFEYDALDNLARVTDPKGLDTAYEYNALGDLAKLTSPDTGVTAFTHDSAGNHATKTDARGIMEAYSYDALNRLVSTSYPDASLDVTYQWDTSGVACEAGETFAIGRLGRITDGSGSTDYCYDRFGHLARKVQVTNGQTFVVQYTHTRAGGLSTVTYPDGSTADYVRDALGRVTEIGLTRPGGSRQVLLSGATHYPFGPPAEWMFGNGRVFKRSLNQNYQPGFVEDASPGGLSLGYEFDAVGNLVNLRGASQTDPPQRRYEHDSLYRLTETRDGSIDAVLQAYSYDATGNRTGFTDANGTQAYDYPADSHRLAAVAGAARSYDAAGNTIALGGTARTFAYNAAGRLSETSHDGTVVMRYAYNGKGEQVGRVPLANSAHPGQGQSGAPDSPGKPADRGRPSLPGRPVWAGKPAPSLALQEAYVVYDEAGRILGEYDGAGVPRQQMIWLDDLLVGLIVGAPAANQPLHYVEADALGTPRVVIEPLRDIAVWRWELADEAFGTSSPQQDPDGDGVLFVLDLRFPGQRYDAASGLNQNGFRDYDPATGRYPQSDPIGQFGDIATYSYASNKPLTYFDFNGLEPIYAGCAGGQGLVVCDGKGGFETRVCNTSCAAGCIQIHEDQHVADFLRRAPNRCKGKPRGASPTIEADMVKPFQYYEFECRAWRATKQCAQKMRQQQSCLSPGCEQELDSSDAQADRIMRDYRCEAYGW